LSLDEERRTPGNVSLPLTQFDHAWALIDRERFGEAERSIREGFEDSGAGAAQLKHAVSALRLASEIAVSRSLRSGPRSRRPRASDSFTTSRS